MIKIIQSKNRQILNRLLRTREVRLEKAEPVARRIVEDVRRNGDRALMRYASQFDKTDLAKEGFTVSRREIREAYRIVPREFVRAMRQAEKNIRAAAERQLPRPWRIATTAGVDVSQIIRPVESVACYVPGGRFPLPSTVLMSVIPAQVAGVKEISVTSPRPVPAVLVAADALGIKKIYRLGGAQAIAAFAYGTRSVPRAAKIVGPGNKFVSAAKRIVAGDCGIDFVAGPTELIMVGSRGRPDWIAADMVAQAEHDPDAVAIFITPSARLASAVQIAVSKTLRRLRLPIAEQSLARQGAIIVTKNVAEAIQLANTFAPEHLTLLDGAMTMLDHVHAAGSIFLGDYSAVAAGDYASGTNHILPTSSMARLRGGLSAADFVKTITVQKLTRQGLARLHPAIVRLAATEGLRGHADSVESRFEEGRGKVS